MIAKVCGRAAEGGRVCVSVCIVLAIGSKSFWLECKENQIEGIKKKALQRFGRATKQPQTVNGIIERQQDRVRERQGERKKV